MLKATSTFRSSAITFTAAGAIALAASSIGARSASAQTQRDCATITDSAKRAVCESFRRTEAYKEQAKAAERESKGEAALKKCLGRLAEFKKDQPPAFDQLGTITRENACEKAAKLPRSSASLN